MNRKVIYPRVLIAFLVLVMAAPPGIMAQSSGAGATLGRPNWRTSINRFLTRGTGEQCSYHSKIAHVKAFRA